MQAKYTDGEYQQAQNTLKPSGFGSVKRETFREQRMGDKPRPTGDPITGHALDEGEPACGTSWIGL